MNHAIKCAIHYDLQNNVRGSRVLPVCHEVQEQRYLILWRVIHLVTITELLWIY
jgi:hypothetical protein